MPVENHWIYGPFLTHIVRRYTHIVSLNYIESGRFLAFLWWFLMERQLPKSSASTSLRFVSTERKLRT